MKNLVAFSRHYGSDISLVAAGGGNTSMKENGVLFVKGSGSALSTIKEENFVALDINKLLAIPKKSYPSADEEREAAFLKDIMDAKMPGEEQKRPSVETLLHALFPQKYVLHLHPSMVNGLTCSLQGKSAANRLFPDAVWVPECRPGYTLAMQLAGAINDKVNTVLLQNHGVFFAADTPDELDVLLKNMMNVLQLEVDKNYDAALDKEPSLERPFTPDHIVYCGIGPELPDNDNAKLLWEDAKKIAKYTASFGGQRPMAKEMVDFIRNWEAESYRKKQA
ncbi:MAG: class II aldolase [Clostridia bacterium]|nr:class II aldolase [Clostridia bacterium]